MLKEQIMLRILQFLEQGLGHAFLTKACKMRDQLAMTIGNVLVKLIQVNFAIKSQS